jgi:hypothetical protein
MADVLLRVGGRDYSRYLKLYTEDQVGVVDAERIAPQFAGNPATSEGAVAIGDAVSNKHWQVAVILRGSADVGIYPGDAWSTTVPATFLNPGAVYTGSSGQVVCDGGATFEGVGFSLGILPAGTYSFGILLRGNAGGEALRLQAGPTASSTSQAITLTASEAPYRVQFTADGSSACYAAVSVPLAAAATYFIGRGVVREQAISVDRANQLVAQIQQELVKGAVVEYRPDGATQSSYFQLESGELRPSYNHPRYKHGYVEGVLELWTRPYAESGTTRLVASANGSAILTFLATGISGDVPALANLVANVGSYSPATTRAMAVGVYPHASYPAIHLATGLKITTASSTLKGASGALASQYYACEIDNLGPGANVDDFYLGREFAGRHRVFGLFRSRITPASAMLVGLVVPNDIGASAARTVVPTATQAWQLVDLGEAIGPDATASPGATAYHQVAVRRSGGSAVGSFMLDYAGCVLLPIDSGARIALVPAANAVPRVPRTAWHLQSYPRVRSVGVGSNPGPFTVELAGRGGELMLAPNGLATAPQTVVVLQGDPGDFVANDAFDASIYVRERWSFFRG